MTQTTKVKVENFSFIVKRHIAKQLYDLIR